MALRLTELVRVGNLLALGDQRGHVHLVRVLAGGFAPGAFAAPVHVKRWAEVRAAVSDAEPLVCARLRSPDGRLDSLNAWVGYADGTWFVAGAAEQTWRAGPAEIAAEQSRRSTEN